MIRPTVFQSIRTSRQPRSCRSGSPASAFDYVNAQLERMVDTIQRDRLASSTTIILTAKHGQSPQDPLALKRIQDGPIIAATNAAWTAQTGDQNHLMSPARTTTSGRATCRSRRRPQLTSSRTICGATARRRCSTTTTA